jgi:hypothetical protein
LLTLVVAVVAVLLTAEVELCGVDGAIVEVGADGVGVGVALRLAAADGAVVLAASTDPVTDPVAPAGPDEAEVAPGR